MKMVNDPYIIIWSLGNEAGEGKVVSTTYQWLKEHDDSRPVQYDSQVKSMVSELL